MLYDLNPDSEYVHRITNGRPVQLVAGDVRSLSDLVAAISEFQADVIVHTAGAMGNHFKRNAYGSFSTNIAGALAVAESARICQVRRLIHCSSLAVYNFDVHAESIDESHPIHVQSLYDHSKKIAEQVMGSYCGEFDIPLVILRLAGIYGFGNYAQSGARMGPRIQAIVEQLQHAASGEVDIGELGSNEYLYIKDVAQAIVKACAAALDDPVMVMNIGSGSITTAESFCQALETLFPHVSIRYKSPDNTNAHNHRIVPLSIAKAKNSIGYTPNYSCILDGLHDYVHEIKRNSRSEVRK